MGQGIIFHDFLECPWEEARGYIREQFESLYLRLQARERATFTAGGILQNTVISGDPSIPTRYIANTGVSNGPMWDLVDLSNGVRSKLALAHLVSGNASTLLGRGSGFGAGDRQDISLGSGLSMTGTVLDAAAGASAPTTAQYVTLATNATLSQERVLTGTANQITITDNGAGATAVLSTPQNIHTAATPQFARVGLGGAADTTAAAKFTGQAYSATVSDGNSGVAKTLDFDLGNVHSVTLTGNVTFTLTNPKNGAIYTVAISSGAGGFTATWPGTVVWPTGTAPVITAAAGKTDLITLTFIGTTYYGSFTQNY